MHLAMVFEVAPWMLTQLCQIKIFSTLELYPRKVLMLLTGVFKCVAAITIEYALQLNWNIQ